MTVKKRYLNIILIENSSRRLLKASVSCLITACQACRKYSGPQTSKLLWTRTGGLWVGSRSRETRIVIAITPAHLLFLAFPHRNITVYRFWRGWRKRATMDLVIIVRLLYLPLTLIIITKLNI